jgi:hypothetical protein
VAKQNQEAMKHLIPTLSFSILIGLSAVQAQSVKVDSFKDDDSKSMLKNFGTMTHLPEDCSAPWDFPSWFFHHQGHVDSPCQMDSTQHVFNGQVEHRSIYTYNETGLLTVSVFQTKFPSGWRNGARSQFGYDAEGRLNQLSYETWQDNSWRNSDRSFREFDDSGLIASITAEIWTGSSYQGSDRLLHQYDGEGRLSGLTVQVNANGVWSDEQYYSYAYHPSGCLMSQEIGGWEDGLMRPYNRKTFTYDSVSRVESVVEDMFDDDSMLHPSLYSHYEYSTAPSSVNLMIKQWAADSWIDYHSTEIVFDDSGNILSELMSYTFEGILTPRYLVTYEHDEVGNMTSKKRQTNSDFTEVNWTNVDWFQAEFDELGNRTFVSMSLGEGNEWFHLEEAISYFDCSILDVREPPRIDELNIFPNPTSSGFHVRLERGSLQGVHLTDAIGRVVAERAVTGNAAFISTEGLASGLYVATVRTEDGVVSKRVVVE